MERACDRGDAMTDVRDLKESSPVPPLLLNQDLDFLLLELFCVEERSVESRGRPGRAMPEARLPTILDQREEGVLASEGATATRAALTAGRQMMIRARWFSTVHHMRRMAW